MRLPWWHRWLGTETKYYFADIGIRAAILNYRQQEEEHHL